jgi:hypothetical protein
MHDVHLISRVLDIQILNVFVIQFYLTLLIQCSLNVQLARELILKPEVCI